MKRLPWIVHHGCRLLLGAVFVWAGAVKAGDPLVFARIVANYRLLPEGGNLLVAATLPTVEVVVGILLLVNRKVRPAALLAALLTLVFIAALLSAWVRGLDIDCGCFRSGFSTPPGVALLRDVGILLLAHFAFYRPRSRPR